MFDARRYRPPTRAATQGLYRRVQYLLGSEEDPVRYLTETELAERMGVSWSTLKRWRSDEQLPYWAYRMLKSVDR